MEMHQLLDIPTGSESVAELRHKLEALEMMLNGFHGEISEGAQALDLFPILHDLLSDTFIKNADPFVRLSTGSCLVQILKLCSSRLLCVNSCDLEGVQMFLVSNISLLENRRAAWFDVCLEFVRSLREHKTLCLACITNNLEFTVDWCRNLFNTVFSVVTKTTALATRQLQRLLQLVVTDLVQVDDAEPILDVIYTYVMDQAENPTTHQFSVNLLQACHKDLELPTQQFFINHLQSKDCPSYLDIVSRKYELMKTLYCACPQLVALSVGGLQSCLEASILNETSLDLVLALSKMFAVADVNLAQEYKHLWFSFLRSLRQADRRVQLLALREMTVIISSHPELMQSCWKYFMLHCVKEASPDMVDKVFECLEAVCFNMSLRHIDCVVCVMNDVVATSSVICKERALKVLAGILVKVLFTPMNVELKQKCNEMLCIISNYYKFGDNRAKYVDMRDVFHDIQRNSFFFRKRVQEALDLCSECSDERKKLLLRAHVLWMSEKLDRPDSHQDYSALAELFLHFQRNSSYLQKLTVIADPVRYSITDRTSAVNELLNALETKKPEMYAVVEQLCTKLAGNYFDVDGFNLLLQWTHHCVMNEETPFRIFCTPHELATEGLKLMFEVLFSSPHLAFSSLSVTRLMDILEATTLSGATYAAWVLKVMTVMSMHQSFRDVYPVLFNERMLPLLNKYVVGGTAKESKFAVHTLANHLRAERLPTLQQLMAEVFEKTRLQDDHYVSLITAAAHLNAYMPWDVVTSFRTIVPRFLQIVFNQQLLGNLVYTKEALMRHKEAFVGGNSQLPKQLCVNRILQNIELPVGNFYERDKIPRYTEYLMASIKTASGLIATMAHWEQDQQKSQRIQRVHCELLSLICLNEMYSTVEAPLRDEDKTHLRLTAGTALLKMCKWPAFWDALPVESFVLLSHLMMDGVQDVRLKLCRKLTRELSTESAGLPVDFLAFYIVALFELDHQLREEVRGLLQVAMRAKKTAYRHCIYITCECNSFDELVEKKPELLVENSLVVAIFLLAHNPRFLAASEVGVLGALENAMTVLLTELQRGTSKLSPEACTDVVMRLPSLRSSLTPQSDAVHNKMSLLCDMVLKQLETFGKLRRKHPRKMPVPSKYFQT